MKRTVTGLKFQLIRSIYLFYRDGAVLNFWDKPAFAKAMAGKHAFAKAMAGKPTFAKAMAGKPTFAN